MEVVFPIIMMILVYPVIGIIGAILPALGFRIFLHFFKVFGCSKTLGEIINDVKHVVKQ